MKQTRSFASDHRSGPLQSFAAKLVPILSRHNTVILILAVCCGVAIVSLLVLRDLRLANSQSTKLYTRSVNGLKRISEMQYSVQETRRCILYALTTGDSNLQVKYADESRDADQGVRARIDDLKAHASTAPEDALARRLGDDWTSYLSIRDEEIALILEGSTSEAVAMDLSRGIPSFERVRQDISEVQRMYDTDAEQGEEQFEFWSQRSSARLIGMLSFTFLISTVAVIGIQRSRVLNAIQLTRLQMEFVASMSHELRTPLAVMGSAADNLADGVIGDKESISKYGAILQRQSRAMSDLVDKMLLFAATENKNLQHVLEPLQVETIVASAVKRFTGSGLSIETTIEPGLPPVLTSNVGISQCLQCLIDNAIKYSDGSRQIELLAAAVPTSSGGGYVSISVVDHGMGIDDSELPQIWDPFYRSPRVRNAQIHGTGLGLALTKRIAESMGGSLTVQSAVNRGTTFTLQVPAAAMKEAAPERFNAPGEVPNA